MKPDGSYAQSDDYIWLDDLPIAQVHTTYGLNNAITSQQLTYIHADHLNTPRAMTDSTKRIVWKWESEAYGKNVPVTDPDNDGINNKLDLRFPGQIADAETGFYYNMNRYYDPVTGRYTQSDPIGLMGGLNTYPYGAANSIRYADPEGRSPVAIGIGVGGLAVCARNPGACINGARAAGAALGAGVAMLCGSNNQDPCDELNAVVQRAKTTVGGLGACRGGMNRYQLLLRYNAWLELATARAKRDEICWKGGDEGHQQAQADAWSNVGKCSALLQ